MTKYVNSIAFNAAGSAALLPNCSAEDSQPQTVICGDTGGIIRSSLLEPISINAIPPGLPPNRDVLGCISDSASPSWVVEEFVFDSSYTPFTSPSFPPSKQTLLDILVST